MGIELAALDELIDNAEDELAIEDLIEDGATELLVNETAALDDFTEELFTLDIELEVRPQLTAILSVTDKIFLSVPLMTI